MVRFLAWFWMGLVTGVSFIATPIKFRATSLTMTAALDVGHVTLHALNRIEWLFCALLAFAMLKASRRDCCKAYEIGLFALAVFLVILQSTYLLPELDMRTAQIMKGHVLPPSILHRLFIGVEATKIVLLFWLGLRAKNF